MHCCSVPEHCARVNGRGTVGVVQSPQRCKVCSTAHRQYPKLCLNLAAVFEM
jgi:hypothetical protein